MYMHVISICTQDVLLVSINSTGSTRFLLTRVFPICRELRTWDLYLDVRCTYLIRLHFLMWYSWQLLVWLRFGVIFFSLCGCMLTDTSELHIMVQYRSQEVYQHLNFLSLYAWFGAENEIVHFTLMYLGLPSKFTAQTTVWDDSV